MKARRETIFILARWSETGDFPDRLISNSPNRAFVTDLLYNTVRYHRALNWVLSQLMAKVPHGETGAALLVGACQLLYMPSVAEHAAIFETVEAAKQSSQRTTALVNGVLRNILRQRDSLLAQLAQQPLGIRLSHPDPLIDRWTKRFGTAETETICTTNNTPAQTWLAYPPGSDSPWFELPYGKRLEELPGFDNGDFIVQDPAAEASLSLLDLKPGLRVLDACAAPGGKTIQIAWRMGTPPDNNPHHQLTAMDLHQDRLDTLRANLQRTRHPWINVLQGDLTDNPLKTLAHLAPFDRILLDVPCSNTGVLRRRPDARWRWTTRRMKSLVKTQYTMLENALTLLAPGGRLVYSTCSIEPEENRQQITRIRKAHPQLECLGVEERIPGRSQSDGAFACALEFHP